MNQEKTITQKLIEIQATLKVPKNRENKFGGFKYRSNEDILDAVKPLCAGQNLLVTQTDWLEEHDGRVFVGARTEVTDGENVLSSSSVAEVPDPAGKKMDEAQATGCASSYARKYSANGLFALDDVRDSDELNDSAGKKTAQPPAQLDQKSNGEKITEAQIRKLYALMNNAGLDKAGLEKELAEMSAGKVTSISDIEKKSVGGIFEMLEKRAAA